MRVFLSALILSFFLSAPSAKCLTHDKWTGPDKNKHLLIGGTVGYLGATYTGEFLPGLLAAGVTGVAIELTGVCSVQDALVTLLGGALGAGTGILLLPHPKSGVTLLLTARF